MKIKIEQAKQTWESPDGKRKLYLVVDDEGNTYKTFSDAIGNGEGKTFDVETYEKQNNRGQTETFIKQVSKQDGNKGFAKPAQTTKNVSEDIARSVALKAAVELASAHIGAAEKVTVEEVLMVANKMCKWLGGNAEIRHDDISFDLPTDEE